MDREVELHGKEKHQKKGEKKIRQPCPVLFLSFVQTTSGTYLSITTTPGSSKAFALGGEKPYSQSQDSNPVRHLQLKKSLPNTQKRCKGFQTPACFLVQASAEQPCPSLTGCSPPPFFSFFFLFPQRPTVTLVISPEPSSYIYSFVNTLFAQVLPFCRPLDS